MKNRVLRLVKSQERPLGMKQTKPWVRRSLTHKGRKEVMSNNSSSRNQMIATRLVFSHTDQMGMVCRGKITLCLNNMLRECGFKTES